MMKDAHYPNELDRIIGNTAVANVPLIDIDTDWIAQTLRLKARKDYK